MPKYAKSDVTVSAEPPPPASPTSWSASCDTDPVRPSQGSSYTGVEWDMKDPLYQFTGVKIKVSGAADTTFVLFNVANKNGPAGSNAEVQRNFSNLSIADNNNKSVMKIDDSLTDKGTGDAGAIKFTYCIMGCLRADTTKTFNGDPQIYNED
jgi:hypothetical protein